MSAKLLSAFGDENPDFNNQIGCMTGIFQIFDRQHLISGRRLSGQNHRRLPSSEHHARSSQSLEKQRISMETSRASFSSSSSSFSSLECSKSTQQEPPSSKETTFQEISSKTSQKSQLAINYLSANSSDQPSSSVHTSCQSHDFRGVVKDSIYRETHGLSVKTSAAEDLKKNPMKHRASPRPMPSYKSMDVLNGVGINTSPRVSMDLAKLKEAPWQFSDAKEPPRSSYEAKDSFFFAESKESRPRLSYDERSVSRDNKSATKLRDLPRLSLDSREGSMHNSRFDLKSNSILKELDRSNMNQRSSRTLVSQQYSGNKWPPGVVAKLMGLEAMPRMSGISLERQGLMKSKSGKDFDAFETQRRSNSLPKSVKVAEESKQDSLLSSKNPIKDAVIARKPIPDARFPNEAAPWKQQEKGHGSLKSGLENKQSYLRQKHESVYAEVEKKLKDLEFDQSNKDLRALKQILDAIQSKGLLETKKFEDNSSEVSSQKANNGQTAVGPDQSLQSAIRNNQHSSHPIQISTKDINTSKPLESPIVIMKPAKAVSNIPSSTSVPFEDLSRLRKIRIGDAAYSEKISVNSRSAKDRTPKNSLREAAGQNYTSTGKKSNNRINGSCSLKPRLRTSQGVSRQSSNETNGSSVNTSGSLSPRMQQRRLELGKKSLPPIPPSDSNKQQRQSRQTLESVSPRIKLRAKPKPEQKHDGYSSETNSEMRNMGQQVDEISVRSDSNASLALQLDVEVTSADRSAELESSFYPVYHSPSCGVVDPAVSIIKNKTLQSFRDGTSAETVMVTPEQPSPISVLDSSLYKDELPASPVIESSYSLHDQKPNLSTEINHKKLRNIEILVEKLRQLSSTSAKEPEADHITSLCQTENPDHRYVLEILLASGLLLKDLSGGWAGAMPIQLHWSGHPINPDLFLVLEQKKSGCLAKPESVCDAAVNPKADQEKIHRKLVFDAVNEILVQKLELGGPGPYPSSWFQAGKLARRAPTGQRLLKELCKEIEQLHTNNGAWGGNSDDEDGDGLRSTLNKDVAQQSEGWTDLGKEVSGLVLDIERSIFKDLIDEVIRCESATNLPLRSSRRRRQLFTK